MSISPSDILLTDRVAVVTGGAKVAIWEREADTARASGDMAPLPAKSLIARP